MTEAEPLRRQATILIVDDHPSNRKLLAALLGHVGHRLLEASSGEEALRVAREGRPDLVLADLLMPTMDGYEFVRRLRADPGISRTPVIFHTAHYLQAEARKLADACGVVHILSKPSPPDVVLRAVNEALGLAAASPPPAPSSEQFDSEHVRLLTDKLSEKVAALSQVNERLAKLVELGQSMASERDPKRLLDLCCKTARRILGARYAVLRMLEEAGGDGLCFTSGMEEGTALQLGVPPVGRGILAALLSAGRAIRLKGAHAGLRAAAFPAGHPPVASLLGAPVGSPGRVHGAIYVADKLGSGEFDEEDERLLATLAAQVGLAYENATHAERLEREVAERRRAEAALVTHVRELNRSNAELQQFAYVASHDLQEPLRMVASYTQLLAKRYRAKLDSDADEFIAYIVEGVTRMHALIGALLEYSRVETGPPAEDPAEPGSVLASSLDDLRVVITEADAVVTQDPLPPLRVGPTQLRQVFQNLIGNAIKFRGPDRPRVHVSGERKDGETILSVRDNGIGIEPKQADRIFRVFQRLHSSSDYPGTGIGLAICKKIVERHGGRIWVESEPGKGSTFYVSLPSA